MYFVIVYCIDFNVDVLKVNVGFGSDFFLMIKLLIVSVECVFNKL